MVREKARLACWAWTVSVFWIGDLNIRRCWQRIVRRPKFFSSPHCWRHRRDYIFEKIPTSSLPVSASFSGGIQLPGSIAPGTYRKPREISSNYAASRTTRLPSPSSPSLTISWSSTEQHIYFRLIRDHRFSWLATRYCSSIVSTIRCS